jgi:metal-responsive CopG/Arc/MetJ family transcriptional regulator
MAVTTCKTSFSLPNTLVRELDTVARVAGVTRSALLTELVSDRLTELYDLIESVSYEPITGARSRQQAENDHKARQRLNSLLAVLGLENDLPLQ